MNVGFAVVEPARSRVDGFGVGALIVATCLQGMESP